MKLTTALVNDTPRVVGLLDENHVIDLATAYLSLGQKDLPISTWSNMQTFLEAGQQAIVVCKDILTEFSNAGNEPEPFIYPMNEIEILAPIPKPIKNIMCVGRNYREHVAESKQLSGVAQPIPEKPLFFTKPFTSVIGTNNDITYSPNVTQKVDYEGELVVVIGREGRDITPEDAMDYVFGYTLMNDVSARDLQFSHVQYFKGKSLDTFAPLGPWIVHTSAIPDYRQLRLQTSVNGELRQEASLEELIFDIPTLISVLSRGMTLHPGDMIATGTPSGVGGGFNPPRFLKHGDKVEVSIAEIGTLSNCIHEL